MASWFYTDAEATQQGPVDEATLLAYNRDGTIQAGTLVWHEGMEEWKPFRDVAGPLFGVSEEGVPARIGVCAHSSQVYPLEEMIPYGEALIGLEHKDAFIQQLMETGTVEVADATEKRFEYVGFWWRALSSFLDYLIKMIPSWICMVPYYVVMFSSSAESMEEGPVAGFTIAMAVAYGLGMLGMLAVSIFYETWMVGKYQGTLGKLIIGARVVNPDGSRLTYKKAFLRWLAKKPLNYVIMYLPAGIALALVMGGVIGISRETEEAATFGMAMVSGLFIYFAILAVCSGVYWMAAFDEEKRALHDRVSGTRVIRK
jgi:uncharacterized RDD family membrane protein YckC